MLNYNNDHEHFSHHTSYHHPDLNNPSPFVIKCVFAFNLPCPPGLTAPVKWRQLACWERCCDNIEVNLTNYQLIVEHTQQ